MMKKTVLSSITALSLLMVTAHAEGPKCGVGNMKMMKKGAKMMKKKGGSPLLLRLPILMKVIKKHWDDPKFALSAEQKQKLDAGMKERMPKMKKLKGEIMATQKEIKEQMHQYGLTTDVKAKVSKLAKLKEEATLIKLGCIDEVKKILNKEQFSYLHELRKQKRAMKLKKMNGGMMKCGGQQ